VVPRFDQLLSVRNGGKKTFLQKKKKNEIRNSNKKKRNNNKKMIKKQNPKIKANRFRIHRATVSMARSL